MFNPSIMLLSYKSVEIKFLIKVSLHFFNPFLKPSSKMHFHKQIIYFACKIKYNLFPKYVYLKVKIHL